MAGSSFTELEQKTREFEQQRRQEDAERATAEAQRRRDMEAAHRRVYLQSLGSLPQIQIDDYFCMSETI